MSSCVSALRLGYVSEDTAPPCDNIVILLSEGPVTLWPDYRVSGVSMAVDCGLWVHLVSSEHGDPDRFILLVNVAQRTRHTSPLPLRYLSASVGKIHYGVELLKLVSVSNYLKQALELKLIPQTE